MQMVRNQKTREIVRRHRRLAPRAAAWLAMAILLAASPAFADRIITKAGGTFTGTIIEEDATKVVLKTLSGTMTIPRDSIKTLEKTGAPAPTPGGDTPAPKPATTVPVVTVIPVDPANAAKALQDAKSALVAGEWVKAGGLLEGLMALDDKAFPLADRLSATGALITCYLQIKDAQGAARALGRRALLATDANDKQRLVAAAEALRTVGSVEIGGKTVSRFEEVVEAAMNWKADQVLADAKDMAAKATRINEPVQLEKIATSALKKLDASEIFVPGYAAGHRKDVIGAFVNNILNSAKQSGDYCEKERAELTRTRAAGGVTRASAKTWNDRARAYLGTRKMAEDALKNLKPFTAKFESPDLYTANASSVDELLRKLDDFKYYPKGSYPFGTSYYSYDYYYYSSSTRIPIELIIFGTGAP